MNLVTLKKVKFFISQDTLIINSTPLLLNYSEATWSNKMEWMFDFLSSSLWISAFFCSKSPCFRAYFLWFPFFFIHSLCPSRYSFFWQCLHFCLTPLLASMLCYFIFYVTLYVSVGLVYLLDIYMLMILVWNLDFWLSDFVAGIFFMSLGLGWYEHWNNEEHSLQGIPWRLLQILSGEGSEALCCLLDICTLLLHFCFLLPWFSSILCYS